MNYEQRRRRWANVAYFVLLGGMLLSILPGIFLSDGLADGVAGVFCAACLVVAWFCVTAGGWAKTTWNSNPKFFFWIWGIICFSDVLIGFLGVFVPWATHAPPGFGMLR